MIKALIPGSFDPITIGHLDLIKRASKLVDCLYVAVMVNNEKKYSFSSLERVSQIEKTLKGLNNVKIVQSEGLTVDLCKQLECNLLIKGVRTNADYEYELKLANVNFLLDNSIETVLLFAKPEFSGVSSSLVKEIVKLNGDASKFIPHEIYDEVIKRIK